MLPETSISANVESDSLSVLASQINDQHDRATRHATSALEHARQAGVLLQQAKQQVGHGGWLTWLADNCNVSPRQAQRYLKVANNWQAIAKNDATSYLTIDDAIASAVKVAAWVARIEALPSNQMLFAEFRNGCSLVFRSARHENFYHFYSYFWHDDSAEGGEAQETNKPVRAAGIARMLFNGGTSLNDFAEVEKGDFRENPYTTESRLPYSQDFYCQMRGVQ